MTYPTGNDRTGWINITIPSLMSADPLNWNLTVYLDIISQLSNVSSSQATVVFSSSLLSIRSAGHLPSGGLVTVRVSLGLSPSPVAKWEYPCVTDITCHITLMSASLPLMMTSPRHVSSLFQPSCTISYVGSLLFFVSTYIMASSCTSSNMPLDILLFSHSFILLPILSNFSSLTISLQSMSLVSTCASFMVGGVGKGSAVEGVAGDDYILIQPSKLLHVLFNSLTSEFFNLPFFLNLKLFEVSWSWNF